MVSTTIIDVTGLDRAVESEIATDHVTGLPPPDINGLGKQVPPGPPTQLNLTSSITDSDDDSSDDDMVVQDSHRPSYLDCDTFVPPDGYASDLMGDDADRDHLWSLTMLEREMILYDRYFARRFHEERWASQDPANRKVSKPKK